MLKKNYLTKNSSRSKNKMEKQKKKKKNKKKKKKVLTASPKHKPFFDLWKLYNKCNEKNWNLKINNKNNNKNSQKKFK